jgi:hypothetical protein
MVMHQLSKKPRSELVGKDELMKHEDKEDNATMIFRQHESQDPYLHDSPEVNKQKTNKGKHTPECSNFWDKYETAKARPVLDACSCHETLIKMRLAK